MMTDASLPAGRFAPGEFRLGHVFSQTWTVFSRNFFTFVLVTAIASLPKLLMPQPAPGAPPEAAFQNLGLTAFLLLLLLVLGTLSQAVVLYGAFQVMRGRPVDLAESASIGLRRFFPIVGLAIIVVVALFLATLLLIVPGVILYLMWFVATPVCVVEQLGPFASLGRSRELTRGHRWKLLGMVLLLFIPALIIGAIIGAIMFALVGAVGVATLSVAMTTTVAQIASLIWSAIWTAFLAILVVVTYHDLRVTKEGIDTDQIAAVFE
jgi:hypothetical protein